MQPYVKKSNDKIREILRAHISASVIFMHADKILKSTKVANKNSAGWFLEPTHLSQKEIIITAFY